MLTGNKRTRPWRIKNPKHPEWKIWILNLLSFDGINSVYFYMFVYTLIKSLTWLQTCMPRSTRNACPWNASIRGLDRTSLYDCAMYGLFHNSVHRICFLWSDQQRPTYWTTRREVRSRGYTRVWLWVCKMGRGGGGGRGMVSYRPIPPAPSPPNPSK